MFEQTKVQQVVKGIFENIRGVENPQTSISFFLEEIFKVLWAEISTR